MPRPQRIEYPSAIYHISNRGRPRQIIFHEDNYYESFLSALGEAHERFDAIFHAYCLMRTHYHLLVETPRANIGRIMRHINGVYTQGYNRLKNADGSLFKGRYKSVLIEPDEYLPRVSRYIHLSPVQSAKIKKDELEAFRWSSYPAYINQEKPPYWLTRQSVYQKLGTPNKFTGYRRYVTEGADRELKEFFSKSRLSPILGSQRFQAELIQNQQSLERLTTDAPEKPGMDEIVKVVAATFRVESESLLLRQRGRQKKNLPRMLAIFYCQQSADMKLNDIARSFNLNHSGSVSFAIASAKKLIASGASRKQVAAINRALRI